MNEKIVTSQAELNAIPVDYNGRTLYEAYSSGRLMLGNGGKDNG